ncbi:GSCFA domain-containing protein [Ferruginibacter lapsinanis]|uniref:GSCFA domain-containing protein n=1 Tax=Ferruginibacter lapsinanis TaxID=563172 RepID=UPI001E57A123|nr:GSCFA domain-containing protein [Ferruginibacter lapsinanis]UEG48909.1 GSCFA domain-containing protein [Ferruginibacter lapsinanis]
MDFHLEFTPKQFTTKINHQDELLLIGSCFTENIGAKLKQLKFSVLENPNGILFNPISITKSISSYIANKQYTETDLFYANECWNSWEHHSRFSHPDKEQCLELINQSQNTANSFLKTAEWVLITVGSAFVYELENTEVVANCHKIPTDKFVKRLLSIDEVYTALKSTVHKLIDNNPGVKIIFTISPVRHLRDGFVENNRSKSTLIQAVHRLVDSNEKVFYFPAYELVIDDLRDYRFYAEDMVHPNYAATNYVWEKFIATCIDESSQQLMKEINVINAARNHKPFNPTSKQHEKFLKANLEKVEQLSKQNSYINFDDEKKYFSPNA